MAKNRRVAGSQTNSQAVAQPVVQGEAERVRLFSNATGQQIVVAMFAAAMVYVAYWPYDSIEVQQGAARYLVAWLLITAIVALVSFPRVLTANVIVDVLAWAMAGWMAISLYAQHEQANVRSGVNECGWWLATAAVITVSRRVATDRVTTLALLRLFAVVAVGVAIYGWHQWWIGIPKMIADYQRDPEAMLEQVGIVAEKGSAMRVVFENRLYDGGPTGTFALANSMAVMLLGGLVVVTGLYIVARPTLARVQHYVYPLAIAIVFGMVLASRSRSAVLAILLLTALLVAMQFRQRAGRWMRAHRLRSLLIVISATLVVGGSLLYALRGTEWLEQAPASVAIRLNYWRASMSMLSDSPWFGVSPGQFKASYESYRAAASNEQIADPHQFLLQIATAGGLPALAVLVLMIVCMVWRPGAVRVTIDQANEAKGTTKSGETHTPGEANAVAAGGGTVLVGALLALCGVWIFGAAVGQVPTFDAGLVATIGAVVFAAIAMFGDGGVSREKGERSLRSAAGYAVVAMAIAMLTSGGISVPGVSLFAWALLGLVTPVQVAEQTRGAEQARTAESVQGTQSFGVNRPTVVLACAIIVCLLVWHRVGIAPIDKSKAALNRFEFAWSQQQIEAAVTALEDAALADRWDVSPWVQLAAIYRSLAVARPGEREKWEASWDQAEQEAIARAPRDPVVLKQLGDNRLIHFQRYQEPVAVQRANAIFERVVELSPSHQAYAAQWAAILAFLGDPRAADVAKKAQTLSRAGGYYERSLEYTLIFPLESTEALGSEEAVQKPASQVLAKLLPEAG
jgi:O-antigen ligase